MMKYSVLIPAAGSGERMHLGYNKVYWRPDERTVLEHTMEVFLQDEDCEQIVVVCDAGEYCRHIPQGRGRVVLVQGGMTRQESVSNGLNAVLSDTVLVHDGARPYLSREYLEAVKKALEEEDAVCLAVPSKDTVKIVKDGYITDTPERSTVWNAQTPQGFRTELLRRCMRAAERDGYTGTDDCSLAERYGNTRVRIVSGSYENIKLTTPEDIEKKG